MKKINDILAYTLGGLFIIGLVLFTYFITDHLAIGAVGFVMMTPFAVYIFKLLKNSNKLKQENKKRIALLIKTGEKLSINLLEAEIISDIWIETITTAPKRAIAIDALIGQDDRHYKEVEHYRNSIFYKILYRGKVHIFSTEIAMEPTSLKMLFAIQKHTFLYVDKENTNNYYIDLSFLEPDAH